MIHLYRYLPTLSQEPCRRKRLEVRDGAWGAAATTPRAMPPPTQPVTVIPAAASADLDLSWDVRATGWHVLVVG